MASKLTCIIAIAVLIMASTFRSIPAIAVVSGPADVQVYQGDTVELHCSVSNKGNILVHWLHGDQYLTLDYEFYPDAANSRYSVIDNGKRNTDFTLRITNVQLPDAGMYQCGHYQPTPSFLSARLSVSTSVSLPQGQRPPDEGFPQCETSPQNAKINQTVRFTCRSQGGNPSATLTWLRSEEAITGQSSSQAVVDRTLRPEDNGVMFRCRLNHPTLTNQLFCGVTPINIAPTAQIDPGLIIDEVGQGALFTCITTGMPEIKFFFDNVEVSMRPDADRFIVSKDFRELTIRSVIASDNNVPVRCDVFIPSGLSASSSGLLRVRGATEHTNETMITPSVTYSNMTTDAYIGNLSRSNFFLIIIIVGTVIGQILLVILVFILHRSLKGRQNDSMNMEWKGVTNSRRGAHEIVPKLANLTAPRRYAGLNPDDITHPRYQDLEKNSAVTPAPPESSQMEVGVYEGVVARELSGPRLPGESSTPRSPKPSPNSPKHPPPRASPKPSKPRLPSESSSQKPSSEPPKHPPPRPRSNGPRIPHNSIEGEYRRPTSNALSSTFGDTASYQGSVIQHDADVECYAEPVEYIEPLAEEDTLYEVPPDSAADGYVLPNPKPIEDSDIDDYELPPTDEYVPV